jgi:hypothetical protein
MGNNTIGPTQQTSDSKLSLHGIETHYSLAEAVELFFPGGVVSVKSLRTEIKNGRLEVVRIGRRVLVTQSAIVAMLEASKCPGEVKVRVSSCANARVERRSGPSETEQAKLSQGSALMSLQKLSKRSKSTC